MSDDDLLQSFVADYRKQIEDDGDRLLIEIDSVNEENIELKAKSLLKEDITNVLNAILWISDRKIKKSKIYAQLLCKFIKNKKANFKELIKKHLTRFSIPIIRQVYELGGFGLDEILDNIIDSKAMAFADIIDDYDHDVGGVKVTKEWIISGCVPGSISAAIKEDDIEQIKGKFFATEGKPNLPIPRPLLDFEYYNLKRLLKGIDWTPINASAFYGSMKCFKFFQVLGAKIDNGTSKMAVAGGNIEILRLCEQAGASLKDCENIAANFGHFELLRWFEEIRGRIGYDKRILTSGLKTPLYILEEHYKRWNVSPKMMLLKLVEKGKPLTGFAFPDVLVTAPKETQIPIARAMLSRKLDPVQLFTLCSCPEFFDFAMKEVSIEKALERDIFMTTSAVLSLPPEYLKEIDNQLYEDGFDLALHLNIGAMICMDNNNIILPRIFGVDFTDYEWSDLILHNKTGALKYLPDRVIEVRLPSNIKLSDHRKVIEKYLSLPSNIKISISQMRHPSLLKAFKNRIASFNCSPDNPFLFALIRDMGAKKNQIKTEGSYDYDSDELVDKVFAQE